MIEPVIDALTTSMSPACSAKNAMISSAMLPNVALRMPPTCGPVSDPSRSVERPTTQASPRIAAPATTKMTVVVGMEPEVQDDRHRAQPRSCRGGRRGRSGKADRGRACRHRLPVGVQERRWRSCRDATESRGIRKATAARWRPRRQARGGTLAAMAILAALFAFGSRFVGKILTTALGWASTLLFGRVPA